MPGLRSAVIMKTDLGGSTPRFRALAQSDLSAELAMHKKLVADIAGVHQGEIVKPEGDAFWIVFPSVTAACLAGLAMQEELRLAQPNKGDDRLAMRIVITLGDVQIEDGALVGDPVVLAARIEGVTPPDEIYVSLGAWLAVKSAEVRTSFVGAFSLKGFDEPAPLYRVESRHQSRVFDDQYLVVYDLKGFLRLLDAEDLGAIESVLDRLLDATGAICQEFDGTTRFNNGDAYCLTFDGVERAMTAAEHLFEQWSQQLELACALNIAVHKGKLYAYRSYVFSRDIEIAFLTESVGSGQPGVYVTEPVRSDLVDSPWQARLEAVEAPPRVGRRLGVAVYRLVPG